MPAAAVVPVPVTAFVSTRAQRRGLLAQRGASITILSAEKRASINAEFEPWDHRLAGRRLEVVGSEAGVPLLSDGSTFSSGPEAEWSYADGLAVRETAMTRTAYLLAPPSTAASEVAEPDDDDEPTPSATPAVQDVSHDEERRARAAAEFGEAVRASMAASQLRPAEAFAAFSAVQDGRKLASRMWDGAFRNEHSDAEWIEQRDHADGGAALTLAEAENVAWTAKFEGALRHLRARIADEKPAGRAAAAEIEHLDEVRAVHRGLVAEAKVLSERRARLERR